MTSQADTHPPRVFKYAEKQFPDPGPEYSTAQVLRHLQAYFPELGHAKTEERTLPDGTVEVTFSKQVTRKGSEPAPRTAGDILVAALTAVPPYDNPLTPVYEALTETRPLTLRSLRRHTDLLHDHADQLHDQTVSINQVILSCKRLTPIPLPLLPWGF